MNLAGSDDEEMMNMMGESVNNSSIDYDKLVNMIVERLTTKKAIMEDDNKETDNTDEPCKKSCKSVKTSKKRKKHEEE